MTKRKSPAAEPGFSRSKDTESLSDHHKLSERRSFEFVHHAMTMGFDGSFGCTELARNLFVPLSPHHPFEDLPFAGGQTAGQGAQSSKLLMLFPHCASAGESALNCFNQAVLGNWLLQKVLGTGFDDLHGSWDICLSCQKNDGQTRCSTI